MREKTAAPLGGANMVADTRVVAAREGHTVIRYNPRRDLVTPKACSHERNLGSREGATLLATELTEWWTKRGFPQAKFWPMQRTNRHGHSNHEPLWGVVSNLVNGLPPRS